MKMRIILLMIVLLGLGGCGTVQFRIGNEFNPGVLERALKTGISTRANVKALLGKPYGTGKTLMPFHDSPRTVWTYFYEIGNVDFGGGNSHDHRRYLFVYFDGDFYDGYMWFDSQMQ